jgi:hypothetical protein
MNPCACGGTGVVPDPHSEDGVTTCPDCKVGADLKVKDQIAREFSQLLTKNIGIANTREAVKRNEWESYRNCCASHDFCDANMVMLEAFRKLGFKDCTELPYDSPEQLDSIKLWNEAWDMARENKFYLEAK